MQAFVKKEYVVAFLLAFGQLIGAGFLVCRHFEDPFEYDYHNYLEMSHDNYNVNVTHRYRFVVPLLAGKLSTLLTRASDQVWEGRGRLWVDKVSFLLVNTLIMAFAAAGVYYFIRLLGVGVLGALLGMFCFTSSFYSIYGVGLPGTDSLYLLGILLWCIALYQESPLGLALAGMVGILGKEAFLMFLPLVVFPKSVAWWQKGGVALLVALVYVAVRMVINRLVPLADIESGVTNALIQVQTIPTAMQRILSVKGAAETLSVYTIFYLPVVLFLRKPGYVQRIPWYLYLVFPIVVVHVLLSAELPRMWLYTFPVVCAMVGIVADGWYRSKDLPVH